MLMLTMPVCSSPETTNNDLELRIFAGKLRRNVGIGVTFEAFNNREETVNVSFMFMPLCLRVLLLPFYPMDIERTVKSYHTVRETCYFPVFSYGAFIAVAGEQYNSSTYIERTGQ
jgi:hypothetical protein